MPSYKLIILKPAVIDFENACFYYNHKRLSLGEEFEEEVFSLLNLIKKNPLLFPVKFSTIHEAVVRRFPYVINYEITEKEIIVSGIFHTKQNPIKKSNK